MKIGTKSVLFGAHCALIHPWFVALAWWQLYGFPYDPRLWVAFFVHDLGYIGKPNMDGHEGELHPYWGAFLMGALFGKKWFDFTLYHSRFLAKYHNAQYSKLCVADKLAFCLTPAWLYLPMVNWSGEIKEYMSQADNGKYKHEKRNTTTQAEWMTGVKTYMRKWAIEHKDIKVDTWTELSNPVHAQAIIKPAVATPAQIAALKSIIQKQPNRTIMKKIITVIVFGLLTLASCKKEVIKPCEQQGISQDSLQKLLKEKIK